MVLFIKFLCVLISINQETILNWLGIKDPRLNDFSALGYDYDFIVPNLEPSNVSLETFHIILDALLKKLQSGLSLTEFENVLFFIVFVRFAILAIRYNIKTSFYITCIGIAAGYLWYRHFIDLLIRYELILVKIPITYKLGRDISMLRRVQTSKAYFSGVRWTKAIPILKSAFFEGIWNNGYLIDPVSMLFSVMPEAIRSVTDDIYYLFYRDLGPLFFSALRVFYREFSSLAAYALVVRIGKPYCPYSVRWHWTFVVSLGYVEGSMYNMVQRIDLYIIANLLPKVAKAKAFGLGARAIPITQEIAFLNALIVSIIILQLSFVTYALLHAICGQYFYVPAFTENVELHIGPRPKTIYSGGHTAWQDREQTDLFRVLIPWYGWFGRGTKNNNNWRIFGKLRKFLKKIFKKLRKRFKK